MLNQFKPYQISVFNAISLLLTGGYGYIQSQTPSPTALIPVVFGLILLILNPGLKKENKVVAHIAVLLTLIIFIGLLMPLIAAINRADNFAVLRVLFMILTTLLAIISFVKSFIEARKNKNQ